MRRLLLAAALVALPLLTGCLGSVTPAHIPSSDLSQEGWDQTDSQDRSIAGGMAELAIREYKQSSDRTQTTSVTVATLNDVPILDERKRVIPIAIEQVEEEHGVSFQEIGTRTIQLSNLNSRVQATEYDIQGGPVPAKAVLFTPSCDDFVAVVAVGATGTSGSGGLFGSSGDTSPYERARGVSSYVVCG